jgi:putative ABC transport system permease protein
MLFNYLKIAYRTLRKRVGPTVINVAGLSVGLAACLLIGLWMQHQFSYDDFHPDADRITRVALHYQLNGNETRRASTPVPLAPAIERDLPGAEAVTQFADRDGVVFSRGARSQTGNRVLRADSSFFDVFGGFEMIHGSRETALDGTGSIVLTASTAQKLFGRTDVVGETISWDDEPWSVTGVMADVPATSHVQFDAVSRLGEVSPVFQDNWTGFAVYTYAKLGPNVSVAQFEENLQSIEETYAAANLEERGFEGDTMFYQFFVQPLPSIHLYSDLRSEVEATGSIATVYTFGAIGLFILLIACINFMNLATARASERATEVGMRKTLGAGRAQLAGQFFGEAVLTTAASTLVALGLASAFLPLFNQLAGTSFTFASVFQPSILLGGLALVVVVGFVAGSYPALALSRFMPAEVLKGSGRHTSSGQGKRLRQGLVVFQFAISIVLILGTLVAQEQFDYIQSKRLGLQKERVVEIQRAGELGDGQSLLVDRVKAAPGVVTAAASDRLFGRIGGSSFGPAPDSIENQVLRMIQVGTGFTETMEIDLLAGRAFQEGRATDSTGILLNRTAVEDFGWTPREAIGQTFPTPEDTLSVLGVVEDFHYSSMRSEVKPLVLFLKNPVFTGNRPSSVYARLAPGATGEAVNTLRETWQEVAGTEPFQYQFLDQTYDAVHRDVQRASLLFSLFAGIAIVIACLGLFGLATYTVQRRSKEIGIRKALGATASQVVGLLSKEFLQLVAVAGVIALPIAYLAMQQWLAEFAYRTNLGVGLFAGAIALAVAIAALTISYHALRAAHLDPATTLQDE